MKQPEYDFMQGSLDRVIEINSHKFETDPVACTRLAEELAEQEGMSVEEVAYTALYNAGFITYDDEE
jgi:hypothetical protein